MSSSTPVILLTGASRGVGLAIAQHLLKHSARLFLVARTAGPLEALKAELPSQVDYLSGDLADSSVCRAAVVQAVATYGRLDGVIVNHGVLEPVARVADADVDAWKAAFNVGFFGVVSLVKEAIPELRKSKGRVVFVSSGAAVTGYEGWGAYGSSKAALNHLATTLASEEKEITSVSIRPGVIGWFFPATVFLCSVLTIAVQIRKCNKRSGRSMRPQWEKPMTGSLSSKRLENC